MLKYDLKLAKDLRKDAQEGSMLYYAYPVSNYRLDMKDLCENIAASTTLTAGEVRNALDALTTQLKQHLMNGAIVEMDNLGSFRISFGSSGASLAEDFKATAIRNPRIIYSADKDLKDFVSNNARYEKVSKKESE